MGTNRRELVHQLQATLSKMEVALGAIADAVVFLSEDSQVEWCNNAFEQLVKRSHSTLIGFKLSELLPLRQAGQPVAPDAYPDVKLREGEYEATEYEVVQGDRSLVLHISGNCIQPSDRPLGGAKGNRSMVLVIRHITSTKGEAAETRKVEQEQGKQAQEALRESEERYRRILETTYEGVWSIDSDGKTSFVNPRMAQMLGYTVEEMLGKHLSEFIDSEGQAIATAQLERRRQGIHENHDFKFCRKDGSDLWTIVSTTAIFDRTGQYAGALAMVTDISDRKRVEEALKASEARLNAILSSAVACIQRVRVYANRDWEYEYSSPGTELIYGYTASEILADNYLLSSRIHPQDWELILPQIFESVFTERNLELEYRYLHPDGNWRWICVTFTSVRDEAADCWITTVIAIDISDKKRAEIALAESELKFRSIVENANDIIAILSPQGIVRYVSPNVVNVLGYTPAELEGQSFAPMMHPDDLPKTWDAFNQLGTTGEKISGLESLTRHKDGRWRWLGANLSALRDVDGNLLIVSVTRDITERKQAEEALRASEARLKAILNSAIASIQRSRVYANRTWNYEYFSPGSELIYGYTAEEILADNNLIASRIHPEDWETVFSQVFENIFAECPREYEYRHLHSDGNWRWLYLNVTSVRNEAEYCWLVTVIATDITDRKHAEIALAESESKFRTIVENANDVIGIVNLEGIVHYISPNVVNLTGFTAAEMEGQSFEPFMHPDEVPKLYEAFNQLATTGERISGLEYRAKHKAGGYNWQMTNLSAFRDASGELFIIGVVRDITERKQVEEALKASEARLNTILNTTLGAIHRSRFYANREWEFEYISAGSLQLWGYTPEEIMADKNILLSHYVPEELEAIYAGVFDEIFAEGTYEGEYRYHHPDGKWRWISFYLTSVRDEAADCWLATVITTDITARKQAEAALEYRARVERLLSSISRHFIDQDVDTAMKFTLEAIANFIGVDRSYIFELSDDMKQYHLTREWCAANIPARCDDGRVGNLTMFPWVYEQMLNHQAIAISSLAEFPPEAIAERATLQRQSIQSMLVVPMTHSDKVVGCLGVEVVRCSKTWTQDDISFLKLVGELIAIGCARHKAEEALLVAKEAAVREAARSADANRAKSTFLANMSHELRTPLNAILGFVQLMERDTTLPSRHRDSLAIINRSGEHLLNLINDVLEMSKIEAGRLVLSPEPVNLHRLLQTLQEIFQVRTQAKRLSLRFELAPDLPQCVLTDEGKLRQVLINLLSNAVKFTETGSITLRVRAQQGNPGKFPMPYTLFFEVEDTGKGIASEEIGNLFQPFVQTTSGIEAREGTGLGLTISRQFIRLMGGDIYLTSTVGKGSTFRFDIQVTLADAKAVAPTLTHGRVLQLAPEQPTYRILVVDDRPEGRDLIAQLLDTVGFETRTATNGQEAIQQWQQWHPQLIWMDMRMPVMDGYEATRQIREQEAQGRGNSAHSLNPPLHQPTVIIALTASAFEEQRASILAAGCDDFVRKPFREQVIFEKMAEYLGVRYVYEQNTDSQAIQEQTSREDGKNLTSDDLAVMPADWVAQLHQAALEVDADRILQLIEQIPATHLALAEGLTDLVRRFCFDEILELSEENCNF